MVEQTDIVVNSGEQITNSPSTTLPVKPEDQFRMLHQRLDGLAGEVRQIAEPPKFRLAETLQLTMIAVGLLIALVGAFSLSERIADVRSDQAASEIQLKDSVEQMEIRLSGKIDKLSDQFSSMDERTSRLEGEQARKPSKPH